MDRWEVKLFERKRDPNLQSRPRKIGRRVVPEDTIPKPITGFSVMSPNVDAARTAARVHVTQRLRRDVCSINVAAHQRNTLIVHVFERKKAS